MSGSVVRDQRAPFLILRRAAPFALVVLTCIAWGGGLGGTFQFDDFHMIVRDEATVDARALLLRLSTGIRPLVHLSYFADHLVWGMRAGGFLLTNLLLHVATVLGVHALARRLLRDSEPAAFLAAALFALQPSGAEVIAYVAGRSTGLMVALFVWGFVRWEDGRRRSALLLFAAACLAKEVALVFPAFLAVRELTRTPPHKEGRRVPLAGAGCLAAALLGTLALSPRYRELARFSFDLRSPLANLAPALRGAAMMVSLWVRPWALSIEHPDPPDGGVATAAALLGIGAIATLAAAMGRRDPVAALCLAWPLLALLPTNSLVAKIDLVTEKPLYLAWVGPALLLGRLASPIEWAAVSQPDLSVSRRRRARTIGMALLLFAWAAFIPGRLRIWSDPRLLWADATQKAPDSSRAWNNLGTAWIENDARIAVACHRRALALDPTNAAARMNLLVAETLAATER